MAESLFASLDTELIGRSSTLTRNAALGDVLD